MDTMRILGHRGASADAPENTLRAFQLALAQGADGVELDVRLCASGEVVVFHDASLDRLVGRPGRVADTPWSTLRTLEVRTGNGTAPIPLLSEVLEALPRTAFINVELKGDAGWFRLATRVARLLLEGKHEPHVVVSSFQPLCLLALAARGPGLRRGYLLEPDEPFWLESGVVAPLVGRDAVHPADSSADARAPSPVACFRQRGCRLDRGRPGPRANPLGLGGRHPHHQPPRRAARSPFAGLSRGAQRS